MAELEVHYDSMPYIMKYLCISRGSVLRWVSTKEIPVHKIEANGNSSYLYQISE